jgi:hypothetical protein
MNAQHWMLLGLAAVAIDGCAQNKPAQSTTRLYAIDQSGAAKSCSVSPTPVVVADGKTTEAVLTVGNDGGWCAITVDQGGKPFAAGLLATRATHGRVYVHTVGDATRIDYTPDPGYSGGDSFVVRLEPGEATVSVRVTATK